MAHRVQEGGKEKASARRKALKAKKEQERRDAFDKQCRENEAKGLTKLGYTKTFKEQSVIFYLNGVKTTCKVDYHQMSPHLEFRGKPSVLTETGYRSHFMQGDLSQYGSLKDAVAAQVEYIIRHPQLKNSKAPYTLTWRRPNRNRRMV